MGSLFGREGRNETGTRRGETAKKSAAALAAVAVAGGSTVVGLPEASAAGARPGYIYWEVTDRYGKPFDGWAVDFKLKGEAGAWASARSKVSRFEDAVSYRFNVIDNVVIDPKDRENFEKVKDNPTGHYLLSDLDPRPGHFLVADPLEELAWMYEPAEGEIVPEMEKPVRREYEIEADDAADVKGYDICDGIDEEASFILKPDDYPYNRVSFYGGVRHDLKLDAFTEIDHAGKRNAWLEVNDENFRPGAAVIGDRPFGYRGTNSPTDASVEEVLYSAMGRLPEEVVSDEEKLDFSNMFEDIIPGGEKSSEFAPIHSVGRIAVCPTDREERPLPTITEVVTETPSPVSTTVTIPAVTSTIPGSTITQPPTTVTEPGATVTQSGMTTTLPPVVSTIPGETITQPGTTVTEPAKTIVTTVPGTTVRQPGETVREPGEIVREPGERVVTTVREPGATVTAAPATVEQEKPVEVEVRKTVTAGNTVTPTVVQNEEPTEPTAVEDSSEFSPTDQVSVTETRSADSAPETTTPAPVAVEPGNGPTNRTMQILATTGANSYALAGLGAVLAALVALAVVSRRKVARQ